MTAIDLSQIEAVIARLTSEDRVALFELAKEELSKPFLANPGPQTNALHSQADILLYGGQAGGGKTALEVGAFFEGQHSGLILRREAVQLDGLIQFCKEIGEPHHGKFVGGNENVFKRNDGGRLKFAGLNQPDDWRKHAGNAKDYIAFDEAGEFLKEQIFSLIGWLRSTRTGQRCRVILGSNPPRGGDGLWMIEEFAPWLDPLFSNPAAPGELRWAIVVANKTEWVEGPGFYKREGDEYEALSRTFIPASLDDNPYLKDTGYRAKLQSLPEPLRSQLLKGDFLAGRQDDEWQVIPSAWVRAAQDCWPGRPKTRMRSLGVDVAQGGPDSTTLAPLHDGPDGDPTHFDEIESSAGKDTPDGPVVAGLILKKRRDGAAIGIDTTGGWGGSARDHLKTHNEVHAIPIVFSSTGEGLDNWTKLGYFNLRAKMYWEFRNALDPENGSEIILPPGARILAQLTAPRWTPRSGKILIESKEDIRKRLGSSTDEADAIVIAWYIRNRAIRMPKGTIPKSTPRALGSAGWMG